MRSGQVGYGSVKSTWWTSRRRRAAVAMFGSLALAATACGGSSPSATASTAPAGTLKVSVTSAQVGQEVTLTGSAGNGCVVDKSWDGFSFERLGGTTTGPATEMATPVASDGSWNALFIVPGYLGGSAKRGPGALVSPGRYQFTAPDCTGHKLAKASLVVQRAASSSKAHYVAIATTTDGDGYWLAESNGRVTAFGDARSYGSANAAGARGAAAIVGMARTSDGHGYWLVDAKGRVYPLGDAHGYGSLSGRLSSRAPVVGIAESPDGKGYWLLAANGQVYGFGDGRRLGAPNSYLAPYDGIQTRNAGGYMVTSAPDAATYLYPGGSNAGGGPGTALSATLVGTAATPSGNGAWEAGADGGVITIGGATYYGSVPGNGQTLNVPATAIASLPNGLGYWVLDASGTVFAFGSAHVYKKA